MAVLVMSWPIGIAVAQVSVPWLADALGWQSAFYASSAWCVLGALAIGFVLPAKAKSATTNSSTITASLPPFTSQHWRLTILAACCWGAFNAGFVVYLAFIDARFAELGFSATKSAAYASLPSWIMPIAAIAAGQWVDRTGARYLSITAASVAATAALLMLAYTSWSLIGVLLFGIMGASAAGVIMSLTVYAFPAEHRAFGMGIFFTLFFFCVLPSPAIAGWLGDLSGSAANALAFGALLFALSGVAALMFRACYPVTKSGPNS